MSPPGLRTRRTAAARTIKALGAATHRARERRVHRAIASSIPRPITGVLLAWMLLAAPHVARAQSLEACRVSWLDPTRLHAVLRVEAASLSERQRSGELALEACDVASATLVVRWPGGSTERRAVTLDDVASTARTRLLALMLVELLRLGPPDADALPDADADRTETTSAEPLPASSPEAPAPERAEDDDPAPDDTADPGLEGAAQLSPARPGTTEPASPDERDSPNDDARASRIASGTDTSNHHAARLDAAGRPIDASDAEGVDSATNPAAPTSTSAEQADWEFGLTTGIRSYFLERTVAWGGSLVARYAWWLFGARFDFAGESHQLGYINMFAPALTSGARFFHASRRAWHFDLDGWAELGLVRLRGFGNGSATGSIAKGWTLSGLVRANVGVHLGPIITRLQLEVGATRGLRAVAAGETVGGINGPFVGVGISCVL